MARVCVVIAAAQAKLITTNPTARSVMEQADVSHAMDRALFAEISEISVCEAAFSGQLQKSVKMLKIYSSLKKIFRHIVLKGGTGRKECL